MNDYIPQTVEAKLDLILSRCRTNLSTIDDIESEWVIICRKVADNNPDITCPLFSTFLYHLEYIDQYIFKEEHTNFPIFRATATGLMFEGYQNKKRNEKIKNDILKVQNERIEANESRLIQVTKYLNYGTWAVASGAIGLVLWEIYLHIVEKS